VISNLLNNAAKYTDPGGHITLTAQHYDDELVVRVRDNGIGIAERYLQKVFQPFKRLHGSEIPGNGIGLALCRRIVQAHGGEIWAASTPGEGSTFSFTLHAAGEVPGAGAERGPAVSRAML
jgi:signal transduction histidine kinase